MKLCEMRRVAATEKEVTQECERLVEMLRTRMRNSNSRVTAHTCTTVTASVFEAYCDFLRIPCHWVADDCITLGVTYIALLHHEEAR